jgi:hypothetical protein
LFYHVEFRCGCPNPLLRVLPFLGLRRRGPLQGVQRLRRAALPIPSPSPPPPSPPLSMRRRARALPRPGLLICPLCPPPSRGLQTPTQQRSRTPRVRRHPICWPAGCAMHKGLGLLTLFFWPLKRLSSPALVLEVVASPGFKRGLERYRPI